MNTRTTTPRRIAARTAARLTLGFVGLVGLGTEGFAAPAPRPADTLKVVATTPGLADIAARVGGDRVEVKSLTKGPENMHSVVVTPRMLVSLKRADVLIQVGLSLEMSWLPPLVLKTRNLAVIAGGAGLITVSDGWEPIAVPTDLSRQGGDLHPQGNPHFLVGPEAGPHAVEHVRAGLTRVDPAGAEGYRERAEALTAEMVAARERWETKRARLAGVAVVVYHQEFDYLLEWLGMDVVGTIESKPGIPPTPAHLARLVDAARGAGVQAVITARWSNSRQVGKTADDLGAVVLELPTAVGGEGWATDWIALLDGLVTRLDEALGHEPVPTPDPAPEPAPDPGPDRESQGAPTPRELQESRL